MKHAAAILTWLGYAATVAVVIVNLSIDFDKRGRVIAKDTPAWVWVLAVIFLVIGLLVVIFREVQVRRRNYILPGVLTIVFASVIGGILTILIPKSERTSPADPRVEIAKKETEMDIEELRNQFQQGKITRDEFDRRMAELKK